MAGRCLPAKPEFPTQSERVVWQALRSKLRDCDVLLSGVRFSSYDGDWEVDLVLLMPEGFATIEVKGGQVRYEGGEYVQVTSYGRHTIDLADQAVSEKYLLRRYLRDHPRWTLGPPRMAHFVALPHTRLDAGADLGPGLPRWMVFGAGEERDAAGRIYDVLTGTLTQQPKVGPGVAGVELAADILGGRGEPQAEVAAVRAERDDVVRRLTEQQHHVLDLTRLMPRYQVVGGPGTGKTFLAMEQARRWAADGMRVAFVAYSRGLTSWVERVVAGWPDDVRDRVRVTTFHALGSGWGAVAPEGATQSDWDEVIPARMADLVASLPAEERFDAIVVDEAQDFGATWWPVLLATYADPLTGRLAVFSDGAQQVFGRAGVVELDLPSVPLDENLRNSGPIAETVNTVLPASLRVVGGYGPDVRFVPCSSDAAIGVADEQTELLLAEGWSHVDIALLTTQHRHPMQVELVETQGRDGYWDAFWDESQFFYSTVPGFKGLERPAVVLAVDGFRDAETARETLTVGMSRARDLLVVCGDPDVLRHVGGKQLVKRLIRGDSPGGGV